MNFYISLVARLLTVLSTSETKPVRVQTQKMSSVSHEEKKSGSVKTGFETDQQTDLSVTIGRPFELKMFKKSVLFNMLSKTVDYYAQQYCRLEIFLLFYDKW